jgi:hypothetical protein
MDPQQSRATYELATLHAKIYRMSLRLMSLAVAGCCFAASAQTVWACTTDHLKLTDGELAVQLCDEGLTTAEGGIQERHLREELAFGGKTLEHTSTLTVPDGANTARVIDDINLAPLGLSQRLHVTVRLGADGPHLEHAVSLPGPTILR